MTLSKDGVVTRFSSSGYYLAAIDVLRRTTLDVIQDVKDGTNGQKITLNLNWTDGETEKGRTYERVMTGNTDNSYGNTATPNLNAITSIKTLGPNGQVETWYFGNHPNNNGVRKYSYYSVLSTWIGVGNLNDWTQKVWTWKNYLAAYPTFPFFYFSVKVINNITRFNADTGQIDRFYFNNGGILKLLGAEEISPTDINDGWSSAVQFDLDPFQIIVNLLDGD